MLKHSALLLSGLILAAGVTLQPHEAQAHVRVGFGIGFGVPYYGYGYGYEPYYYPPPVVYAPPPVVYAPPPPPVNYIARPQQSLYYCDNPRGYYPSVQSCGSGWREVPASSAPDNR
ncbi:MAG: hypothetical protein JWM91_4982 [Rhodospirillales bacterium]|nr:hypothetical protein [Rhodospirillales bacterium]